MERTQSVEKETRRTAQKRSFYLQMKKNLTPFILGFLASTFLFLTILSIIRIPEYILTYEVECKKGPMT
jgi:hypothetical protein